MNSSFRHARFDLHTPFWQEWLGNALYFPLLNLLGEILLTDPLYYLLSPACLGLIGASLLQAGALVRWPKRRMLGNLIGPAIFTVIGLSLYGIEFLAVPNHIAYWVFGLLLGLMQTYQTINTKWLRAIFLFGEALLHGITAATMYYLFHIRLDPITTLYIPDFLAEPGHQFATLTLLLLGAMTSLRYLPAAAKNKVEDTQPSRKKAQKRSPEAPAEVAPPPLLWREERMLLVINLRGLTHWSEAHQPEETASLLHRYYQTTEATLRQHGALKLKTRAGEVLAFFNQVDDALQAALKLRLQINALLHRHGLSAAIGLHSGLVSAGWRNEQEQNALDEIAEAIEIVRAIEASAAPGELLASEKTRLAIGATFRAGPKRFLTIAGRDEPITIYPLE
ncbi:MAG: hypothetical protein DDG60_10230 [Anaerolineae bacterium]|nr:MAG: hypothetical protein DDG60_10230 [Anaerolineae bacterium]